MPRAETEPGPHWWKAIALTTTPTLPPIKRTPCFSVNLVRVKHNALGVNESRIIDNGPFLETHYPSGRTWAIICCSSAVVRLKTGTRPIIRRGELPFVVRIERRATEDY